MVGMMALSRCTGWGSFCVLELPAIPVGCTGAAPEALGTEPWSAC